MTAEELDSKLKELRSLKQNIEVCINCGDESAYWKVKLAEIKREIKAIESHILDLIILDNFPINYEDILREAEGGPDA